MESYKELFDAQVKCRGEVCTVVAIYSPQYAEGRYEKDSITYRLARAYGKGCFIVKEDEFTVYKPTKLLAYMHKNGELEYSTVPLKYKGLKRHQVGDTFLPLELQ